MAVPRLVVGLPVYNGENFLEETIAAVLAQTFTDLRLIISDNASTDRTSAIVASAAARDRRVTVLTQPHNLGAAPNYNAVFAAAPKSDYFVWVAHDDLPQPTFFEECIAALDEHGAAVLAFSTTTLIGPTGDDLGTFPRRPRLESPERATRFFDALHHLSNHPIFGVMRRSALDHTRLHGSYTGSDRTLLAEMALLGPFIELDEPLFQLREHPERSVRAGMSMNHQAREAWFDTSRAGKLAFPRWRRLRDVAGAVLRTPMPTSDRLRCFGALGRGFLGGDWKPLVIDLVVAFRQTMTKLTRRRPEQARPS